MGQNFQPVTQYYQIGFEGYQDNGGPIDPFSSLNYFNMIAVTSTNATAWSSSSYNGTYTGSGNDVFSINGYNIGPFYNPVSGVNVTPAELCAMVNAASPWTGVIANFWRFWGNGGADDYPVPFISLTCAYPSVQTSITLANVNGTPLGVLGLPIGSVTLSNAIYGSSFNTLVNGSTITLNGTTITFTTGGGLNAAGAVSTINNFTGSTNVLARKAGAYIQLNSLSQAPILFGPDTAGATGALGFTASTAYASAMTYDKAIMREQGNMRWAGVASYISSNLTPTYYGQAAWTSNNGTCGPEGLTWVLGVEHVDQVYTRGLTSDGLSDDGVELKGPEALKRLIARALANQWTSNRNVYNPNVAVAGSSVVAYNTSQVVIQQVTAPAVDTVANLINGNYIWVYPLYGGAGISGPEGGW
jgi:hypothetical protein